jgi:hypothetical protein
MGLRMAIMHLYLLLLAQGPVGQVLDRYEVFRKSQPVLISDFHLTLAGNVAKVHVVMERDSRLRAEYRGEGLDYVASFTPKGNVEMDRVARVYDESPGLPQVRIPRSHLTRVLSTFPFWMMEANLRHALPKGAVFKSMGKVTLDGAVCDRIRAEFQGAEEGFVDAAIDGKGAVHDMNVDISNPNGRYAFHWQVTKMEMVPVAPANAIRIDIPNGFKRYNLPLNYVPHDAASIDPNTG